MATPSSISVPANSSVVVRIISILEDLTKTAFTSDRLPRHCLLRTQIKTLLDNKERIEPFCVALHGKLAELVECLTGKTAKSREASFWPSFHRFRLEEAALIWKQYMQDIIPDLDHILIQKVTLRYALDLLKERQNDQTPAQLNFAEEKKTRRQNLTIEEENAIRYTAGYVLMKMNKLYESKGMVDISGCILNMHEGTSPDGKEESDSFLEYTRVWIDLVDRGGLFKVNDNVYRFFLELELSVYPKLSRDLKSGASCKKKELQTHVLADEDILFAWSLLTIYLTEDDSTTLLASITDCWITLRGFSLASQFLEEYKHATRLSLKGKRSLRKELSQAEQVHGETQPESLTT